MVSRVVGFVSRVAMGEQRPREEGLAQGAWEVFHLEAHWSWFAYLRISVTWGFLNIFAESFDRVIEKCTASFLDGICICKFVLGRYFIWRRIIGQCHGLPACAWASQKNFFAFVYALFCWIGICGVTLLEYTCVRLLKMIFFSFLWQSLSFCCWSVCSLHLREGCSQ